jgi:hypothetical protein
MKATASFCGMDVDNDRAKRQKGIERVLHG